MEVDVTRESSQPTGRDVARVADAASALATDPTSQVESTGDRDARQVLRDAVAERLRAGGVTVDREAGWLVEAATTPRGLVDRELLDELVTRRVAGEPLQVLVGETGFRFVTVGCRSGVFVPRPETEVVAGVAIDAAAGWPVGHRRVVDLCTGTGAIALAVASEVPAVDVVAVERDAVASDLARANVAGLASRPPPDPWSPGDHLAPHAAVRVVEGDLYAPLPDDWHGRVAVVVANPPYLPAADRGSWAPEVAGHDPDTALVGGAEGHEVVDAILARAPIWLAPGGTVVVEIDERRGPHALAAAGAAGLVDATLVGDLAGRDRAVVARRASADHDRPSTDPASGAQP